jgi:hypothetical protein
VPPVVIENPILNSPFDEPTHHFRFDAENNIAAGRRPSSYFLPIAAPKKKAKGLFDSLIADEKKEETDHVNKIRAGVKLWGERGWPDVTAGIPSVTLEGTPADWRAVADRAGEFGCFDLGWWVDPLRPVLDEFVAAAEGRVNRPFWESNYKWQGPTGSGSPHVSGWVRTLFPYLDNPETKYAGRLGAANAAPPLRPNPWLSAPPSGDGPGRDEFPSLPAKAPFVWKHLGTAYQMEFVGGLVGVAQDPATLGLRPEIGWAVRAV